jgi:hypothetical protein
VKREFASSIVIHDPQDRFTLGWTRIVLTRRPRWLTGSVDPHVPDSRADAADAIQDAHAVMAGQPAADVDGDTGQDQHFTANDALTTELVQGIPPWTNRVGGPALLWRVYFDSGADALELAELLIDRCSARGVTAEIKGVDEYTGREELIDVHGVLHRPRAGRPGLPRDH